MDFEHIVAIAGFLILASIIISKVSDKFGIPSLILFLIIGMLAGSDGLGNIYFDDVHAAQSIGVIALIYIIATLISKQIFGGFEEETIYSVSIIIVIYLIIEGWNKKKNAHRRINKDSKE